MKHPKDDRQLAKVAQRPEERKELPGVTFEYINQKDNLIFLRKRK